MVKNPPTMQETWVQSLGQEDPLEKRMATHSRVLAWRIPWTVVYQTSLSMGFFQARVLEWVAILFSRGSS